MSSIQLYIDIFPHNISRIIQSNPVMWVFKGIVSFVDYFEFSQLRVGWSKMIFRTSNTPLIQRYGPIKIMFEFGCESL